MATNAEESCFTIGQTPLFGNTVPDGERTAPIRSTLPQQISRYSSATAKAMILLARVQEVGITALLVGRSIRSSNRTVDLTNSYVVETIAEKKLA
ncbi:hypothetical protein LOC68_08760 [Blastopirellula sp. JC732]|uniref:Uncharacterized protein n=1 Tax=Blastopirellula sediminis TaxID=2894196 RepID=A0A9X1SIV7_9BACT|nr:hypothetical protein [Blastopirellula sediminis]MCC9608739.1 hypothetical protein [Blastopirellula sediminis]MCC9628484.1 hypothetical protein [Blastopirellula sediminis]